MSAIASIPVKAWKQAYQHITGENPEDYSWQRSAALGLVSVFGEEGKKWLELSQSYGRNSHDATYWLPSDQPAEKLVGLKEFLFKNAIDTNAKNEVSDDQVVFIWSGMKKLMKWLLKSFLKKCAAPKS